MILGFPVILWELWKFVRPALKDKEIGPVKVFAVIASILFLIGILASRRVKSMSDYYVGGKNMGFWAVAFSARATGESGWLLIGLTGSGIPAFLFAYAQTEITSSVAGLLNSMTPIWTLLLGIF